MIRTSNVITALHIQLLTYDMVAGGFVHTYSSNVIGEFPWDPGVIEVLPEPLSRGCRDAECGNSQDKLKKDRHPKSGNEALERSP